MDKFPAKQALHLARVRDGLTQIVRVINLHYLDGPASTAASAVR